MLVAIKKILSNAMHCRDFCAVRKMWKNEYTFRALGSACCTKVGNCPKLEVLACAVHRRLSARTRKFLSARVKTLERHSVLSKYENITKKNSRQ